MIKSFWLETFCPMTTKNQHCWNFYAAIVQSVEYTHGKGEIAGSIPVRG